jgi:hypothetical protein
VHTGIWWGDLRATYHLKNLGVDGWNKHVSSRSRMGSWTGLLWLKIGTGGGLL